MPTIIPMKDLRDTSQVSALAHGSDQPIFVTKNGYGDLVLMSMDTYERLTMTSTIDASITQSLQEMAEDQPLHDADTVLEVLKEKYFG